MLVAAALALMAANSGMAESYERFIHFPIELNVGEYRFHEALAEWVKDVLMVGFFFVVGMELKREIKEGVLTDMRQVMLPLGAAIGGMVVPAAIFLLLNGSNASYIGGWAIPTATDIAFALAVLLLAAKNVPAALKIFLLAIAIFDDLGAILIIAFFYSKGVMLMPLLLVAALSILLALLNHRHVSRTWPYLAIGIALCIALYHAGIHTTIGGVITGLAIPMRDAKKGSPLNDLMHALHPWVSFFVLPLFAYTAAGISLHGVELQAITENTLTLGIILGLFVGKQIGIFGATWLLVKTRVAKLPKGIGWAHVYAVSVLAGIGFTMSLFIGSLAFKDTVLRDAVKLGVLAGSLLSALVGFAVLKWAEKR